MLLALEKDASVVAGALVTPKDEMFGISGSLAEPKRLDAVDGGSQLQITLAMRLKLSKVSQEGNQSAIGLLEREHFDRVTNARHSLPVEAIKAVLTPGWQGHLPAGTTGDMIFMDRGIRWKIIPDPTEEFSA
jgi:hypothetical protein